MFNEIVAHYDDLITEIGDTIAYTVTIPDSGILALEEVVRRMGFDPATLQGPGQPHSVGSLSLHQVGAGIATLDWINPTEERLQVTDRLAGEGWVEHPEPARLPFTHWTEYLGPLIGYADFFTSGYDGEEAEAEVDMTAACLAVVELESGVRLDRELMDGPCTVLPVPEPDFAQFL
ncbi:hypothetical protein [Nonomuraea typhae]|uniref:Uncharacterized protein n=1 Tax=Nonomuraea typhae TaxID=2603600 RepID=A0ABW7YVW9_9ACTN